MTLNNRKQIVESTFLPVIDYGDTIYMHASASVLKPLDAVYHSAIRFITGDRFSTHHCTLYQKVNWLPLKTRREMHLALFVYKALLHKLPPFINSLLTVRRSGYQVLLAYSHENFCNFL